MFDLQGTREAVLHMLFPHLCRGCGSDIISRASMLCARCISQLPTTEFHFHANNPVEKIFWGRLPLIAATAQYYFTKESLIQKLMHGLKYKGEKELGKQLGRLMGLDLQQTNRFNDVDALVPLPLFPARERKRGYNQATLLCEGMAEVLHLEVLQAVIARVQATESQTKKGRMERWMNIEGKFSLRQPERIHGRHLLLVDDVITTGATLEACGQELLKGGDMKLSIATLCFASR